MVKQEVVLERSQKCNEYLNQLQDIAKILAENNYLSEEKKELLIKIIAFRNILVHDYLDLDRNIIFKLLKNNLEDIRGILKSYLKLILKKR